MPVVDFGWDNLGGGTITNLEMISGTLEWNPGHEWMTYSFPTDGDVRRFPPATRPVERFVDWWSIIGLGVILAIAAFGATL